MKRNETKVKKVLILFPRKCISCGKLIWLGKYWCKLVENYSEDLFVTDKLICCKKCASCMNDMDKVIDTWACKKPLWTYLNK